MESQNSMLYWWPLIKDLPIPKPWTILVEASWKVWVGLLDGKPLPDAVVAELLSASTKTGFPLFMRTDLASAKHDYKWTCYVPDASHLFKNLGALIDCTVAQDLTPSAIALRRYIPLASTFTAWRGLPIARERRYFIKDGQVQCHHPYWPADAVAKGRPTVQHWQEELARLNYEDSSEVDRLTSCTTWVGQVVAGYWSVDFAYGQNGEWYLIDMAEGERSWHPECPMKGLNAPRPTG